MRNVLLAGLLVLSFSYSIGAMRGTDISRRARAPQVYQNAPSMIPALDANEPNYPKDVCTEIHDAIGFFLTAADKG